MLSIGSKPPLLPPTAFHNSKNSYTNQNSLVYNPRSNINELPPPPLPLNVFRNPLPLSLRLSYTNRPLAAILTSRTENKIEKNNSKGEEKLKVQKVNFLYIFETI